MVSLKKRWHHCSGSQHMRQMKNMEEINRFGTASIPFLMIVLSMGHGDASLSLIKLYGMLMI